jgi:hypothetical protein
MNIIMVTVSKVLLTIIDQYGIKIFASMSLNLMNLLSSLRYAPENVPLTIVHFLR